MKKVYLIENDFGICKIGVSKNPEKRICTILKQSGCLCVNKYISKPLSIKDSMKIESSLLKQYDEYVLNGEWIRKPYKNLLMYVCNQIEKYQEYLSVTENKTFTDDQIDFINLMLSCNLEKQNNYKADILNNILISTYSDYLNHKNYNKENGIPFDFSFKDLDNGIYNEKELELYKAELAYSLEFL